MKELRFKMPADTSLLAASALLLMLGAVFAPATAAPEPLRFSSAAASNSGFISNPSIYTYTIANTGALNKSQQQQQYQQQLQHVQMQNAAANDVINGINFATSTNYHSSSSISNSNSGANSGRRNYYFTNNLNAKESGAPTAALPTQPAPMSGCNLDRLAVYKVVLHTYWTRDLFPKHYPDWRPSAQWTKTIGRTHDGSYALYHIGQPATMGVKQYAETGKTEILDSVAGEQQQQLQQQQQQIGGNSFVSFVPTAAAAAAPAAASVSSANSNQTPQPQSQPQRGGYGGNIMDGRSVFDEFNMPAILNGAGRSEAKFFVDSNHSLVSLMTRIVPSPDWYIGVDSFQLCVGGSWIDTVTVELDPLDAGTDNGFTFTAPNWPTSPQGVIYRITARYPAHPAGSFFYPKSKRLPPIATFQFIKLKEYELSEVFNFAEDDRKYETVKTQTHLETEHNHVEMNNELSASIERERQNEIGPQPTSSVTERDRIRSKLLAKMNPGSSNNYSYINSNIINNGAAGGGYSMVPKNDKNALMQNIANSYQRSGLSASSSASAIISSSSSSSSQSTKRRRTKGSRDCRVSHWTDWSPCSKTCGIGEMHRYRKVIKHGKRGGRPCPALQESKWCGTEKGCHSPASYFNWSIT